MFYLTGKKSLARRTNQRKQTCTHTSRPYQDASERAYRRKLDDVLSLVHSSPPTILAQTLLTQGGSDRNQQSQQIAKVVTDFRL
jgi:hypothetical protein